MKIVVLDGYTLNPGDLSWDGLKALGDCEIHDRTPPEEVRARAADAEIALTNKTVLDRRTLGSLPKLRYIGVLATGYNVVDVQAAGERNIVVTNVPDYATGAVAQFTMALLLELALRAGDHSRTVREGRWANCRDFCYWDAPLIELDGLTLGLIGFGRIGRAVGHLAMAFGMEVLAFDVVRPPNHWVEFVDLETLLRRSDVVSLHCPLSDQTDGLINADRIALMKPTAFLINTARGPLVNERDLAEALDAGKIAGAAVDVLRTE
ncbi:MAG TPA: D-2-hydroxyacid dehydrogenase, partial [Phycisphaerae bacterium]|nr:D-2-hydroxyacid dehydrogenase [Phycisphaerae bacterium]